MSYTKNYGAIIPSKIINGKSYDLDATYLLNSSNGLSNIVPNLVPYDPSHEQFDNIWIIKIIVSSIKNDTSDTDRDDTYIYLIDNYGITHSYKYTRSQPKMYYPTYVPTNDPNYNAMTGTLRFNIYTDKQIYMRLVPLPDFFIDIIKKNNIISLLEQKNKRRDGTGMVQEIINYNFSYIPLEYTFQNIYKSIIENIGISSEEKLNYEDIIEECREKIEVLEKEKNVYITKNEKLKETILLLKEQNHGLIGNEQRIKDEISKLDSINKNLEKEHNKLKVKQRQYEEAILQVTQRIETISNQLPQLPSKIGGKRKYTRKHNILGRQFKVLKSLSKK